MEKRYNETINYVSKEGSLEGDIILEYGGLKIGSADELIKATKTKTNTDHVEILVLRGNYRLRFIINGGIIWCAHHQRIDCKRSSLAKYAL